MSLSELERFVADAESNAELQAQLRPCRSQAELLLAARCRGYHITRVDLQRAWQQDRERALRQASGS